MKNNDKYFRDANAFVHERFNGVDGFENFANETRYAANGQGQVIQQDAATSDPYEIRVVNANALASTAVLFGSNANRTAANQGNPAGVTVTSAIAGITYVEMLADSETKNFECGMTYIEVESGSNSVLTATWSLTGKDSSGEIHTKPVTVKVDPNQNQDAVVVFKKNFKINGFTNIQIVIPALTTVRYSFYPAATAAAGRSLGNVSQVLQYTEPQIGKPLSLNLSPAALSALRG